MNNVLYTAALVLFAIAGILWLTAAPSTIEPMRLTVGREVTLDEYQRDAAPRAAQDCATGNCPLPEARYFPSPLPMPPDLPESVPGRNLPVFATEEGGRALTEAEMAQWSAARAADPAYQEAVRRMQERRAALASRGMLTAFDGGRCTLAQSAEKCREERARLDAQAAQWARDSRAARERGEP